MTTLPLPDAGDGLLEPVAIERARERALIEEKKAAPVRLSHGRAPDPKNAACDLFDETARAQLDLF